MKNTMSNRALTNQRADTRKTRGWSPEGVGAGDGIALQHSCGLRRNENNCLQDEEAVDEDAGSP